MARELLLGPVTERSVLVRYFLDGPGYNIDNSSSIFWHDPPARCTATHIENFLTQHHIMQKDMVVQVFLERFKTYMSLHNLSDVMFDFSGTSRRDPGRLDVRLSSSETTPGSAAGAPAAPLLVRNTNANMSPLGLFGFSMVTGLHSTYLVGELTDWDAVERSWKPKFAFYAFFVGGLVQLIAGLWETRRNNLYGGTAFTAFGCFWLANGLQAIFSSVIGLPDPPVGHADVGNMVVELYILFFAFGLFWQTFASTALSTTITVVLQLMLVFAAFEGFNDGVKWTRAIVQYILSAVGFYGFFAELTDEIYNREILPVLPWTLCCNSTDQGTFEGAGKGKHLMPMRVELRDPDHFQEITDDE